MSQHPSAKDGRQLLEGLITTIVDNSVYLSEVDGLIGDGDHGVNMKKGFLLTKSRLEGKEYTVAEGLKTLGTILLTEIGGSMGPLYGSMYREMAKAAEGLETLDTSAVAAMITAARKALHELGGATVGDKTLMDVLIPAEESMRTSAEAGVSLPAALQAMEAAAEAGKDSTKGLRAKIGRSARLGDRSIGVLDAGACSCCLMLQSMAKTLKEA